MEVNLVDLLEVGAADILENAVEIVDRTTAIAAAKAIQGVVESQYFLGSDCSNRKNWNFHDHHTRFNLKDFTHILLQCIAGLVVCFQTYLSTNVIMQEFGRLASSLDQTCYLEAGFARIAGDRRLRSAVGWRDPRGSGSAAGAS